MVVKESIACIVGAKNTHWNLLKKLAQTPLHLLFVPDGKTTKDEVLKELEVEKTQAEIDWVNCAKEGCWEADMIAFMNFPEIAPDLMDRIKEVATQKIVLYISTSIEKSEQQVFSNIQVKNLRETLPYSKIVGVLISEDETQTAITGNDREALDVVAALFDTVGYRTKKVEL